MSTRFISASDNHLQISIRWRTLFVISVALIAGLSTGAYWLQRDAKKEYPVDTTAVATTYVNFCRVSYMPEEVILDLGLNTALEPSPQSPVKISHRIVVNYFTLKRMAQLFNTTVEQYESTYGPIETDTNKRVKKKAGEKE